MNEHLSFFESPQEKLLQQAHRAGHILVFVAPEEVEQVRLFGSIAKNKAGPRSDIDLLVAIPQQSLTSRIDYTEAAIRALETQGFTVVLHFNEGKFRGPWNGVIHLGIYDSVEDFPDDAKTEGMILFEKTNPNSPLNI